MPHNAFHKVHDFRALLATAEIAGYGKKLVLLAVGKAGEFIECRCEACSFLQSRHLDRLRVCQWWHLLFPPSPRFPLLAAMRHGTAPWHTIDFLGAHWGNEKPHWEASFDRGRPVCTGAFDRRQRGALVRMIEDAISLFAGPRSCLINRYTYKADI